MKEKEITRDYFIDDAEMLGESRSMLHSFQNHQADFAAFDPTFDATFLADWDADIEAAYVPDPDFVIEGQLVENTENLDKEMDKCRKCFQDAKFFIEKAYPDNPQMWKVFGYAEYLAARTNPEKMLVFLLVLNEVAEQNATELAAANYTQTDIDTILVRKAALESVLISRTVYLRSRSLKTRERVLLLNKAWSYMPKVSSASKSIYSEISYSLYHMFLLPESKNADRGIDIKGRIKDAATGENLKGVQAEIATLNLKSTTNAWGFSGLGNSKKALTP